MSITTSWAMGAESVAKSSCWAEKRVIARLMAAMMSPMTARAKKPPILLGFFAPRRPRMPTMRSMTPLTMRTAEITSMSAAPAATVARSAPSTFGKSAST